VYFFRYDREQTNTHTQTDPLITILRSPIESGVKTNMAMIPLNDSTTVIKRSVTGTKFQKKVPLFWRYWTFLIHSIRCAKGSLPMIIISLISSAISTDQPTHRQIQGHTTQPHYYYRPYYLKARFPSPSSYTDSDEPFPAHVMLTCTNGVSPNHLPMIAASDRP